MVEVEIVHGHLTAWLNKEPKMQPETKTAQETPDQIVVVLQDYV